MDPYRTGSLLDLRARAAHHEAGHAVFAVGHGRTIRRIRIETTTVDGRINGCVEYATEPQQGPETTEPDRCIEIRSSYAGPAGEYLYLCHFRHRDSADWHKAIWDQAIRTSGSDIGEVQELNSPRVGPVLSTAELGELIRETIDWLRRDENWRRVSNLAGYLCRHPGEAVEGHDRVVQIMNHGPPVAPGTRGDGPEPG